jgi:hypothetical protein
MAKCRNVTFTLLELEVLAHLLNKPRKEYGRKLIADITAKIAYAKHELKSEVLRSNQSRILKVA